MPAAGVGEDAGLGNQRGRKNAPQRQADEPMIVRSPLHTGLDAGVSLHYCGLPSARPKREEDGVRMPPELNTLDGGVGILSRSRVRLRLNRSPPMRKCIADLQNFGLTTPPPGHP